MSDEGAPSSMSDGGARRPLEVAVVGMTSTSVSGMRDHAQLLAEALAPHDIHCSVHWLARSASAWGPARREVAAWAQTLGADLAERAPDGVLLHYASFAYSHRGVPLYLRPTLSATRRPGAPLVAMLHELVYPWRRGELRANVWAFSQRAALRELMRASAGALVTMDFRAHWLRTRRWLPERPLGVAPVYSNLPPPSPGAPPSGGGELGLFGYGYEGVDAALVLDALATLARRGVPARLTLLGYPGPDSERGQSWRAAAERRGVGHLLSFSGILPAQELSDALARCEVLLFAALQGPSSNRGTLAGSLASGRPLVAIDGPRAWAELGARDAARIVEPTAPALADAVAELLADEGLRASIGARGRALYDEEMSVERTAQLVAAIFRSAL